MVHVDTSINGRSKNGRDDVERYLRWARLILSIVAIVGGWALALTIWLVSLRIEVEQLKQDTTQLRAQIDQIDKNGTRALDLIRNRQSDVIATNAAQDARIRELENKLSELQRISIENRFLIDQLTKQR